MFLKILKWTLLTAVILLVGQIRIGGQTVGERFHGGVKDTCAKAGTELKQTKMYASLVESSWLSRWLNNVYPPPQPASEQVGGSAKEGETDAFTPSDRESILQLLN